MPVSQDNKTARRAVIVAGNRTPFVKAFSEYLSLDTIALGVEAGRATREEEDASEEEPQPADKRETDGGSHIRSAG